MSDNQFDVSSDARADEAATGEDHGFTGVSEEAVFEDTEETLPSDHVADLVEYFVVNLVSELDAVMIDVADSGDSALIEIHVAPGDVGRIIGRHGRVIKSLRTLARACAARHGINVEVEVAE